MQSNTSSEFTSRHNYCWLVSVRGLSSYLDWSTPVFFSFAKLPIVKMFLTNPPAFRYPYSVEKVEKKWQNSGGKISPGVFGNYFISACLTCHTLFRMYPIGRRSLPSSFSLIIVAFLTFTILPFLTPDKVSLQIIVRLCLQMEMLEILS